MSRQAVVTGGKPETIARYLPSNYRVVATTLDGAVLIEGEDVAGWTLEDYVIPRLGSGLYGCREL